MSIKQDEAEKLLEEFASFPREKVKRTYLEICRYPYSRFEEICSRLLCFYFDPNGEHGFKNLFLASLFEVIGIEDNESELTREVKIHLEEYSGGKRLDLIIEGKGFIIGIENKIYASLYNDLANYREKIEAYTKDHTSTHGIVLSLNKLQKDELKLAQEHNFISITYEDFFNTVKKNIGFYLKNIDTTYFIYLKDFITTITNLNNSNMDSGLLKFFQENNAKIKELIELYNQFNASVVQRQQEKIGELFEKIKNQTKGEWWIYQGYDLGCQIHEMNGYYLGLESEFISELNDPFAKFVIKLTAWRIKDWDHFQAFISLHTGQKDTFKTGKNKTQIILANIESKDEDTILFELKKAYDILSKIVSKEPKSSE
ncbi:MAG: PD-(D/E)XK nuclease family protein [Saprospiraceae bacterium]